MKIEVVGVATLAVATGKRYYNRCDSCGERLDLCDANDGSLIKKVLLPGETN